MNVSVPVLNAFIEDTCVVVVIAYALARGRLLFLMSATHLSHRNVLYLGAMLGLIGCTEVAFPGARSPYVTHTLIVTFAAFIAGIRVGLIAAAVVCVAAVLRSPTAVPGIVIALLLSAVVGMMARSASKQQVRLWAFLAGIMSQSSIALISYTPAAEKLRFVPHTLPAAVANGVGMLLVLFVVEEARTRAVSEQHRLELEQARTAAAQAQWAALRARVHPHFLFNTLTSLAALCRLAPVQAEAAVLRLSQMMRRALESSGTETVTLGEEMEFVRGYLEIEQYRMGDRLTVIWDLDPAADAVGLPAFVVETLVENAILHGLSPKIEAGTLRIITRQRRHNTLVVIADNGVGMSPAQRQQVRSGVTGDRVHGLQIAGQQLVLLSGLSARIRLLTRPDRGTIAAFSLPNKSKSEYLLTARDNATA